MMKPLDGHVALVTGATRGLGRGIAIGLGEAGATVYITGRTLTPTDAAAGSLIDTSSAVQEAGGTCIPVPLDHSDDVQVQDLFNQIQSEQNGHLDLLVNNAYGGVTAIKDSYGTPFWELSPTMWDASNNVGLRSHYVASTYAARLMVPRQRGLICNISSWGGLAYIFNVAYGAGKSACDRLATDMAVELKPHNVAALSLWPGIVGTELMTQFFQETSVSSPSDVPIDSIQTGFNWETPLLTGRVIAALAADSTIMGRTGRVQIVAELARHYGITDAKGNRPASLRSLQFILPFLIPVLRNRPWLVPDLKLPWWSLLIGALGAPKL